MYVWMYVLVVVFKWGRENVAKRYITAAASMGA